MSIAAAYAGAQAAQTHAAISTAITKQNHEAEAALVSVIEQAVEAGKQAGSDTAPGTGGSVDITA